MTRINIGRTGGAVLVATAAFAVLVACDKKDTKVNNLNEAPAPSAAVTQAELIAEATGNYTYDSARAAVPVDTTRLGGPGGTLPTITIATAHRTLGTGRLPGNRFIGRLNSSAAYPRLKLAPGLNYVWRDSSASAVRFLIVPANLQYPMYFAKQEVDHTPIDPSGSELPRLVKSALAYAMCDGGCGNGHCRLIEGLTPYASPDDTTVIMATP